MKWFYFLIIAVLFFTRTVFADCNIISTLKIGSRGAEVACLQGKVGIAQDGKFGPLTNVAIMVLQSNNGLVADGIVGPLSRVVLNNLKSIASEGIYPTGCAGSAGYSSTTGIKCDSNSVPMVSNPAPKSIADNTTDIKKQNTNPNLVNLDRFIDTVVEVNRKKGLSESDLKLIADNLRTTVVNSKIDYNKKFEELLVNESKLSANLKAPSALSFVDKVLGKAFSFLGLSPSVAQALTGTPFGGTLTFPFYCTASSNWMLTITPLPPSYVVLLSYTLGTQKFASYNIPFTRYLLGEYTQYGQCQIYAGVTVITITTEGTIAPMVGSSPV